MTTAHIASATGLQIDSLALGQIGTNCYVVRLPGASDCLVVDPGGDAPTLLQHLDEHQLSVAAIVITHCHWDHIGAVADLVAATSAPVWMETVESVVLEDPASYAFPGTPKVKASTVDHKIDAGATIEVAGVSMDVLAVPGHSPGHIALLVERAGETPVCFIGDVIFRGSVGRTDLPFSDGDELMRTLDRLKQRLHPDTVLLSGHGEPTTMVEELRSNPFLRA